MKTYFVYIYDENGYHNGKIEAKGITALAELIAPKVTEGTKVVITDLFDNLIMEFDKQNLVGCGYGADDDECEEIISAMSTAVQHMITQLINKATDK